MNPIYLVVEPTHLKKYSSKWESAPGRGENKKIFETTTQKTTTETTKYGL